LRFVLTRTKLLVETSGIAAAAAVMFKKLPADVKRAGVVLSGGNIDPDQLATLLGK
jgi:threonine dehydratase